MGRCALLFARVLSRAGTAAKVSEVWHVIKSRAMARTPLFARLVALLAREKNRSLSARPTAGADVGPAPSVPALTRREFVERSLLGLAVLGTLPLLSACGSEDERPVRRSARAGSKDARVVIVGGG